MQTVPRLSKLRQALETQNFEAFVSFFPPDNEYLSGFRGTTSALIVTADTALLLCDFRYTEQAASQAQGVEVHEVAGTIETRAGERLKELGLRRVGFEPVVTTVHQASTVQAAFERELMPHNNLVAGLRMRKDADEISRIRAASELAEGAMLDLCSDLHEGITERAFAAKLEYEFKRRGAQGASFAPIVLFGSRSSLPHGMPGDRQLAPGDIVLLDLGCILDSYCSDLTRTFVFANIPGTWFDDIYGITEAAQRAALAAVRSGVPCKEVDAVARDMIRDAGYGDAFGHGLGHGVGLEIHEAPRLNMQSEAVLESGMIITIEPGIYLAGQGGVRIEDLAVVTDAGCEVFTRSPKELRILGI